MTNDHSNYEVVKLDMNLPASVRLITRKSFAKCEPAIGTGAWK